MGNHMPEQAYRVLARKYRPQDFSDLIGQEPMVRTLTNAFEAGRIAQAWMLTGVRGVGKTTTARILARALNYKTDNIDRPTIDLSMMGEHCQAIMEGRHVDVVEMDAASHTGIDDIREIIEQVRYRPVSARYKVYIIDEVHMLSTQAFNGLLKTLEEPPPHVKFIFATTEIRKVPITVLSRCQRFDLRRIDSLTLTQHLQKISQAENISVDDTALAMIARAGEGSVRDALSILDQAIAHGAGSVHKEAVRLMLGLADRSRIIDLFELIMSGDIASALQEFKHQYDAGADPVVVLTELADFNHFVTRLRFTPQLRDDLSLSEEERHRGGDFAQKLSIRALSRNWQMLLKGISEVDNAPRPLQAAEMLLIRLAHAADLPSIDEALKAIVDGKTPDIALTQMALAMQKAAPQLQVLQQDRAGQQDVVLSVNSNLADATPKSLILDGEHEKKQTVDSDAIDTDIIERDEPKKIEITKPNVPSADIAIVDSLDKPEKSLDKPEEQDLLPQKDTRASNKIEGGEKKKLNITSLKDIVALADENRDIQIKIYLKEYVRPITVEQGLLEYVATDDAPRNLSTLLSKTLREWTGNVWSIKTMREGGGMTLTEMEGAQRSALLSDAQADSDVNAILAQFPGAKIVDVRLNNIEPQDDGDDIVDSDFLEELSDINDE